MPQIFVDSIDDPRLAAYRQLNQRNLTRQSGLFIAEGEKVVERLISSRFEVASLLAEAAFVERLAPQLPPDAPIYVARRELLEATIGFNFHRGVLACGRRQPPTQLAPLLAKLPPGRQTIVICDDVQDPTNLGSIIRATAAFGCAAVVLGSQCADPFSRRVLRVSMGTALHLPIVESRDLAADLAALRAANYEIAAAVLEESAEPLKTARRGERLALLLGNEAHGLAEEWLHWASRRLTIPMQLGVDSLNVAVAAAVMLFHFTTE